MMRYLAFTHILIGIILWGKCDKLIAQASSDKIIIHQVSSPFQADDSTQIRVRLPDNYDSAKRYKVVYVLPVTGQDEDRFGNGLKEIIKYSSHHTYHIICVAPESSKPPWFADHGTNNNIQDERHFLQTVIPFMDTHYPTINNQEGRLLVGFSKSGWGAFTLLLRNPELFDKAVGWDIGIRVDTGPISEAEREEKINRLFGNKATFEKYRLSSLLKQNGALLGTQTRLFYYNTQGKRGPGGAEIHQLMVKLNIPHLYVYEPKRKHRWDSGWLPLALKFLVQDDIY